MEETQETQEETEPKKRRHKKNARLALETLCDRLESCINAPNQKPAKMIDALQKVADVRLRLLDYDTATASDAAIAENAALKTQRDADLAEITRLRNQKREIVTIQDEEAPKLRQQVAEQQKALESLQSFIKYLASEVKGDGDKPKMAITLILKFGRTAREYVTGLGIAFDSSLPSRNCGSIPVPEAGPTCDKARFPWHRRCEIRRNVWLPHEVCC
jgi:hypothetical protein